MIVLDNTVNYYMLEPLGCFPILYVVDYNNISVENIFCSLPARTFEYREMIFQCHALFAQVRAREEVQLQYWARRENTFAVTICARRI